MARISAPRAAAPSKRVAAPAPPKPRSTTLPDRLYPQGAKPAQQQPKPTGWTPYQKVLGGIFNPIGQAAQATGRTLGNAATNTGYGVRAGFAQATNQPIPQAPNNPYAAYRPATGQTMTPNPYSLYRPARGRDYGGYAPSQYNPPGRRAFQIIPGAPQSVNDQVGQQQMGWGAGSWNNQLWQETQDAIMANYYAKGEPYNPPPATPGGGGGWGDWGGGGGGGSARTPEWYERMLNWKY